VGYFEMVAKRLEYCHSMKSFEQNSTVMLSKILASINPLK
jgi:hypothetical protein